MRCEYCTKERDLLCGEDWRVFICGDRLICKVDVEVHDEKVITECPVCGSPLSDPTPLTLEELRGMDGEPVWIEILNPQHVLKSGWYLLQVSSDGLVLACDKVGHSLCVSLSHGKLSKAYTHKPNDREGEG